MQEIAILDWIQQHLRSSFGDAFFSTVTHFGDGGLFWIGLGLGLLLIKRTRRMGLHMLLALALGGIFCNLTLKPLVNRVRPFALKPDAYPNLVTPPVDASFPSGHSCASFGGATAIFYGNRRIGLIALVLATLVALSRLYLYIHFPTDVLVGVLLGIFDAWLAQYILLALERRYPAFATWLRGGVMSSDKKRR